MRFHRLEISAFGPFAGTETIDFDRLTGDGLFLVSGPTGAGKTSVFDALCFGLFGRVPGARNDAAQFRSQFAPDDLPTRVVLDFSAGGRTFRVERTPAYDRVKKRGGKDGATTRQRPTALLEEWVDGERKALARTMKEAAPLIEDVLHVNAEQFSRIVMLPQGEFARFLRADPQEREPLLRQLFGTGIYQAVTRVLEDRAAAARSRLTEESSRRRGLMEQAAAAHSPTLPVPPAPDPTESDLLSVLVPATALYREQQEVAGVVAALAQSRAAAATDARTHAERRLDDRRVLEDLSRLDTTHAEAVPAVEKARAVLDAVGRSRSVVPALTEHERSTAALARAEEDERTARQALDAARGRLGVGTADGEVTGDGTAGGVDPATLAPAARELSGAAEGYRQFLAARADLTDDTTEAQAHHTAAEEAVVQAQARVTDLGGRIGKARESTVDPQALRTRIETHEEELTALDASAALLDRVATARAATERTRTAVESARDRAREARESHARLVDRRLAGIAGELAADLEAGAPCPVCGGTEHPAPAVLDADHVTREDVASAQETAEAAAAALHAATEEHATAEHHLAGLRGALGDTTEESVATERARLRTTLTDLQDRFTAAQKAERALARLEADLESARTALDTAHQEVAAARGTRDTLRERLEALAPDAAHTRTFVRWGLPAPETPEAATGTARAAADLETAARDRETARTAVRTARTAAAEREAALTTALQAHGFGSVSEVRDLAGRDTTAESQLVAGHEERRIALDQRRADDRLSRARTDEADTADLEDALARASEAATTAHARAAAARDALAVATDRTATAHAVVERTRDRARAEAAEVEDLVETVRLAAIVRATSPENTRALTLESYALVDLFARVAEAATERLLRMSAGRYRLVHSLETARKEKRAGLGLRVFDDHTQETRDTRSLSGGETFLASLALALGLADTVQAAAGGIQLDSLFIDEGFGSLDPATLDEVLGVLEELRSGGRTVGIISHVTEMKERLDTGIEVLPGPSGSTVRVSIAGAGE
ncbi:SMC family ATPase [Brevibacterium litoralis]|uniref:SMC family ATPase n=1 Tax=Brevibacterium litoralis TaxID=3138935 RepID=UPI0032ED3980